MLSGIVLVKTIIVILMSTLALAVIAVLGAIAFGHREGPFYPEQRKKKS